jgi:hypothetical protein
MTFNQGVTGSRPVRPISSKLIYSYLKLDKTTQNQGGFSLLGKSDTLIPLRIIGGISPLTCPADNSQERWTSIC